SVSLFIFLRSRAPPRCPLFPYTTLFRSARCDIGADASPFELDSCDRFIGAFSGLGKRFGPRDHAQHAAARRNPRPRGVPLGTGRSEEHTSELQSRENLVCRLLLEKKKHK